MSSLTAAFVLALSAETADSQGHHYKDQIPNDAATTIANLCSVQTVMPEDTCASLYVTQIAGESGNRFDPCNPKDPKSCDSGKAVGPLQLHAKELGMSAPSTWTQAITQYWPWLVKSMKLNPDHPLAALCGSWKHPRAIALSDIRVAEAKRILAVVKAKAVNP